MGDRDYLNKGIQSKEYQRLRQFYDDNTVAIRDSSNNLNFLYYDTSNRPKIDRALSSLSDKGSRIIESFENSGKEQDFYAEKGGNSNVTNFDYMYLKNNATRKSRTKATTHQRQQIKLMTTYTNSANSKSNNLSDGKIKENYSIKPPEN